jgi:hypothetical protein
MTAANLAHEVHDLYHVSEEPGIARFDPRPPPSRDAAVSDDVVWAVDEAHLVNYLVPRDCPRVAFRTGSRTTAADRERFLGGAGAACVLAVEARWRARIAACRLYVYHLPPETFRCADANAGYYVSRSAVAPKSVTEVGELAAAIHARNVEFRVLDELWSLRDAVIASTLEFSIIRMRNAAHRGATPASSPASR